MIFEEPRYIDGTATEIRLSLDARLTQVEVLGIRNIATDREVEGQHPSYIAIQRTGRIVLTFDAPLPEGHYGIMIQHT